MKVCYIQSLLDLNNSFVNFNLAGNGLLSQVEPEDLISDHLIHFSDCLKSLSMNLKIYWITTSLMHFQSSVRMAVKIFSKKYFK